MLESEAPNGAQTREAVADSTSAAGFDALTENQKRKKKVRSAWISFVSRILAQLIGAAATVFLGLLVIQKYGVLGSSAGAAGVAAAPVEQSAPREALQHTPGAPLLAVLPFENYSADARQEYVANAMTEAIVSSLAQDKGLRILSRTSSMHYKGTRKPLTDIGRELGVAYIVEGSVVRDGGRVRVIAQLIDAATDEHVWAGTYAREFRDVLSLQDDVAAAIVRDVVAAVAAVQWQMPVPVSRKDASSTGMNSQR